MGIPSYFSHIIEKYSKIVLKNVEKVDNLLMDCNSIIYDVLRKMDISNINYIQMDKQNDLIDVIKEWVKIDNEIKHLKNEENKRKNQQKVISKNLMKIMSDYNIDEFELKDGKIIYTKKNVKKPITKKMLLDLLTIYYKNDIEKANDVNNFILDNREEKVVETIKREINK